MMRCIGHEAHMAEVRIHITIWLEKLKERDHSEEPGIDGKIISERILRKQGGKVWTECI